MNQPLPSPNELIRIQSIAGRQAISPENRNRFQLAHLLGEELCLSRQKSQNELGKLVQCFTAPVLLQCKGESPDYAGYVGLAVINRFCENIEGGDNHHCLQFFLGGIAELAKRQVKFDLGRQLSEQERQLYRTERRVSLLRQIIEDSQQASIYLTGGGLPGLSKGEITWERLLNDPLLSLVELTNCPQSSLGEERIFLTGVQISEIIFALSRLLIEEILLCLECEKIQTATVLVWGLTCAFHLLHSVMSAVQTVVPSFMSFRPFTGDASAIKSYSFQLMSLLYHGGDTRKFQSVYPHYKQLRPLGNMFGSLSLRTAMAPIRDLCFIEALKAADKKLMSWKYIHLSIARQALKGVRGTGDTEGVPYLEKFIQQSLFTEPVWDEELQPLALPPVDAMPAPEALAPLTTL